MTRTALMAISLIVALTGCSQPSAPAGPQVARSAIGLAPARPVTSAAVRAASTEFMRSYLRIEVDRAKPADRARLRARSTPDVGRLASLPPRPTNHGYPPQGHLSGVQVLPTLTPGRWTVQARVRRGPRTEQWELHLTAGPTGPTVATFQTTAGGQRCAPPTTPPTPMASCSTPP